MNHLQQYLLPYLISLVAAVVFLMIAYKNTRVARLLFAVTFLGASAVNFNLGLNSPDTYLIYADMSLPFYRHFILGWFSQSNHIIVPLIACGQLLIGVGMLLTGWWVRWACYGAILFLLAITPLMTGSAFPFPLLVSWAAWIVLKRDEKSFLWQTAVKPTTASGQKQFLSPAAFLSWITWMLAVVATATGLFAKDIYRDNVFVQTAWQANDWLTLLTVLPLMLFVLLTKKTIRVHLLWAGLLGYLIYNYAFYLFGAAFNKAFLVYVGIVAGAVWAMVDLLRKLPVQQLRSFSIYNRWIASYLFLIAAMLFAIEVPPSIGFSFTGLLPAIVVKSGHPTSIVYALDLTMIFPALLVAGYWLWQRKPWGYVLAAILLFKSAAYGLVLCSGTVLLMLRGVDRDPLLPFYLFITAGGFSGLFVLLRSLKMNSDTKDSAVTIVATGSYREVPQNEN